MSSWSCSGIVSNSSHGVVACVSTVYPRIGLRASACDVIACTSSSPLRRTGRLSTVALVLISALDEAPSNSSLLTVVAIGEEEGEEGEEEERVLVSDCRNGASVAAVDTTGKFTYAMTPNLARGRANCEELSTALSTPPSSASSKSS